MIRIGVIGCGRRISGMLRLLMERHDPVRVTAIADPDEAGVRARLEELGQPLEDDARFFPDADALLAGADRLDAIAIGTRCHQHTPMAVKVAATGLPLFLEKPVAIDLEQLHALRDAWAGREDQVVVSFPLRMTPLFVAAREYVDAGRVGTVNQVQACNNVSYGDVYYASWYRRYQESQGLWLQKATHDFDYLAALVGARPVRVTAMMTQRFFGSGRVLDPDECGYYERIDPDAAPERIDDPDQSLADHGSRFHAAIRNQDAGSAIVWFENGVIVSYSQNFVTRGEAGRRGAIVTGYDGTVEFDWSTEELRWVDHHGERVDRVKCPGVGGHGGGDAMLADAFFRLVSEGTPSPLGLDAGLQSVATCLAAREAARTGTVQPIEDMGLYAPTEPFDASGVEP